MMMPVTHELRRDATDSAMIAWGGDYPWCGQGRPF